jgi:5-formyltetrahydrofolate cyclo-ligase
VHALVAAWDAWRGARVALVYLAFGDELDPLPASARSATPRIGPRLATTRTVGAHAPLELRAWSPPFERHPFGFWQPRPDAHPVDPEAIDLVLVPGLAFDVHGARLGHGQGHYDRLLPRLPRHAPRVGVAPDALVVERVPTEPHDVAMTHLLTPSGLRAVAARGPA